MKVSLHGLLIYPNSKIFFFVAEKYKIKASLLFLCHPKDAEFGAEWEILLISEILSR
jgi:hypothetical protein